MCGFLTGIRHCIFLPCCRRGLSILLDLSLASPESGCLPRRCSCSPGAVQVSPGAEPRGSRRRQQGQQPATGEKRRRRESKNKTELPGAGVRARGQGNRRLATGTEQIIFAATSAQLYHQNKVMYFMTERETLFSLIKIIHLLSSIKKLTYESHTLAICLNRKYKKDFLHKSCCQVAVSSFSGSKS